MKIHVQFVLVISLVQISVNWTHAASAQVQSSAVELCSPKDGVDFEVSKPLLFWKARPGASGYEIDVDSTKVGEAPSADGPILHHGLTAPLAPGPHHWSVKALFASGGAVSSETWTFTIQAPGNWPDWAIGPFVRYGGNPIGKPEGTGWESVNTLSPGVIFDQGKFRMLYRAQGRAWTSREGYAESADGVTFTRNPQPVIDATEPWEQGFGCEDARLFKYQGTYYAFFTSGSAKTRGIELCEATSPDGITWKKLGPIQDHTKNGAVICDPTGTPVKINGKFALYFGNSELKICYSDDLVTWGPGIKVDPKLPAGWVGPWEPCVAVTDSTLAHLDNVVLFIAGTLNGKGQWFYAISEALFNKADLTKKVDQLNDCILKPREPYDSGQQKNSLWTNCIIQHDGQWMLYHAAGDRFVALATAPAK